MLLPLLTTTGVLLPAQCVTNATALGLCAPLPSMEVSRMPLGMTGRQFCSRLGGACQAHGECCLGLDLTVNDLAGLPPLPKPHYSWPLPWFNASRVFMSGLVWDYVRIIGTCPLNGDAVQADVEACATLCQASTWPEACIGIDYSPYFGTAAHHADERATGKYPKLLARVKGWLAAVNNVRSKASAPWKLIGVGALLLDSESLDCNTDTFPNATPQLDYIFNASRAAFPTALVEYYNRGGVQYSEANGWAGPAGSDANVLWNHFTVRERGDSFSVSLYSINQIWMMREHFRKTVAVAIRYNTTAVPPAQGQCDWEENRAQIGKVKHITPWLALGGGGGGSYSPTLSCSDMHGSSRSAPHSCPDKRLLDPFGFYHNDYDRALSWQLGSELNHLERYDMTAPNGKSAGGVAAAVRLAPWNYSKIVALYPSPFDSRFLPENGSSSGVRHFASYVRGAAGIVGYPSARCVGGICAGDVVRLGPAGCDEDGDHGHNAALRAKTDDLRTTDCMNRGALLGCLCSVAVGYEAIPADLISGLRGLTRPVLVSDGQVNMLNQVAPARAQSSVRPRNPKTDDESANHGRRFAADQTLTLSQYDQISAEVNNSLDVNTLTTWLEDSNANTMSFLLWDTNGHGYLDMVRFLEATKGRQGHQKLRVWVTLIPPSETYVWVNRSECAKCPPSRPYAFGSVAAGTYCCDNPDAPRVNHCMSKQPECCVVPGTALGCQSVPRCGNNPDNRSACGTGDPGLPVHTSRCSVPADSPLTMFNESALVDPSKGYKGCNDYAGWGRILNKLAAQFPNVVAVNIDDFTSNLDKVFNESSTAAIMESLHGSDGPGVKLIPTFYYSGPGPQGGKSNFVLSKWPWLAHATDGALFYYTNTKAGQNVCRSGCSPLPPAGCKVPCLYGTCAERTLPLGLEDEISDFANALAPGKELHIGLYFSGVKDCVPSDAWSYMATKTVLSLPSVSGATIYTFTHGNGSGPRSPKCLEDSHEIPKSKGCIVKQLFHQFGQLKTDDEEDVAGSQFTFREHGGLSSASRAAAATATMRAAVLPGGALQLQGASTTIVVASTFSAPGPVTYEFNRSLPAKGWHVHVHPDGGDSAVLGRVTGVCAYYQVERMYFRTGLGMGLIGINDTIVSSGDYELVGIQSRHYASLVDPAQSHIDLVVGPSMEPNQCETTGLHGLPKEEGAYGLIMPTYAGTNGNPSIFASVRSSGGNAVGIGLLALDDVTMVHAETANHATFPCNDSLSGAGKELARPWAPAIQLADPHLAIAGGSSHTSEWAVIALGPDCSSYWCYINLVRSFTGVTDIEIKGNGPLNAFEQSRLVESGNGIAGDFRNWSVETTRRVLNESNLKYFITKIPWTAEQSKCEPTNHKYAHGSAFVHELAPDCEQYIKDLVRVLKAADPDFKVLVYLDAFISSETNGSIKYHADRILRADLTQQCYGASRPGVGAACCAEWPLFYPFGHHPQDLTNAYAKQLDLYLEKVFSLGADGIYHDESSFSISPYTWITDPSRWDGVSAAFNASLHATTKVSNLNLIRQAHHIALMTKAASRGQLAISNFMPQTRTYTQMRLSPSMPLSIHFVETGAQIRGYHTHFFTPWMLNREQAQSRDEDPKYNYTVGDNPGLNVLAHLDYGALSNLCSRLMKNGSTDTVYQRLTPITPVEVGRGYVLGIRKLVTKVNSSVCFSCDGKEALQAWVYDSEGQLSATQKSRGTLELKLPDQHVAIVEADKPHGLSH